MRNAQAERIWVVIPAAGLGQRMGSKLPKQYITVNDKTVIEHTIDCFLYNEEVAGIVVVLNPEDKYWDAIDLKSTSKMIHTVIGGSERSDSVLHGLKALRDTLDIKNDNWVMVHDAARPCLPSQDIDALLAIRLGNCSGGILASPVRDTMKKTINKAHENELDKISYTESRKNLWHALTPQMFRLGELITAIEFCQSNNEAVTDDCSAMEKSGVNPVIVEGSHNNIKVTYPSDIDLVSFLLRNKEEQRK